MSNHQIIRDEDKLKEFIDWLPELGTDEVFFLCLQARRKYLPTLKSSDKQQLKRFVATKRRLFDKIRQLECPVGSYLTNDGEPIPDQALALYITLNPRDMRKATYASIKALVDVLQHPGKELNPHSEVLSEIHKAKGRSTYVHFDLDMPTGDASDDNANKCPLSLQEVKEFVASVVGEAATTIVRTRGGCHVLIAPDKVQSEHKNWYPIVRKQLVCDQTGDLMIPVVGTNQGGFIPHFYVC
jgi:hypothetical protein